MTNPNAYERMLIDGRGSGMDNYPLVCGNRGGNNKKLTQGGMSVVHEARFDECIFPCSCA